MLRQFKNIDTAFKHIKLFTIVVVLSAVAISCFAVARAFQMVEAMGAKIYILAGGKALEALSAERKDNIPVEARDHIRNFHYLFFTLVPDEKVIESNMNKALGLADGSANMKYQDLKEAGFYSNILTGNVTQDVSPDSIVVDMSQTPYYFKYYGKITITRATVIVTRNLNTEGWLRSTLRSDNNPHGFLIERWNIIDNSDLKTIKR